jgi:hypothetical protein
MKEFKQAIIRKIRDARYLPFNQAGADHYVKQLDPAAFKAKIDSLLPRALEVVS